MKCPACGFDSPDDAGWCDFCKEPFRKRASPPPEAAAPAASSVPPSPETRPDGAPPLPGFPDLDPGERIPAIPRWVRLSAWAFLAIWFIFGIVLLGYYLGAKRSAESESGPQAGPQSP